MVVGAFFLLFPAPAAAVTTPAEAVPTSAQEPAADSALELQRRLEESRAAHDRAVHRLEVLERHRTARLEQVQGADLAAGRVAATVDASTGVLDAVSDWATGDKQLEQAHAALSEAEHLRGLAAIAERGVVAARREVRTTARDHREARLAAERLELSTAARASARLGVQRATLPAGYEASTPEQDQRNRRALAAWRRALITMGEAGIVPPSADVLERRRLPGSLRPARDDGGRLVPGVALARGRDGAAFQVVPDVSVRAVSAAFASLGLSAGDERSCAEFIRDVWDSADVDVATDSRSLWESLSAVSERQVVVGDLVFFRRATGHGIGISVGQPGVLALDPTSAEVAVLRVAPSDVLGVRRATLSADRGARVAALPPEVAKGCEPPAAEAVASPADHAGGWSLPMAEGSFSMSAGFGVGGALWSSGSHTGQDFAAPMGTPVSAVAAGRVTVEAVGWAGQLVRVDHGGGVETWYAHMSRVDVVSGDTVTAGAAVGAVGSEGNSTGPHLHFEVRVDGAPVDPISFLSGRDTP